MLFDSSGIMGSDAEGRGGGSTSTEIFRFGDSKPADTSSSVKSSKDVSSAESVRVAVVVVDSEVWSDEGFEEL